MTSDRESRYFIEENRLNYIYNVFFSSHKEDLKTTKKTIKLSKELSDLVTCCKSVRFDSFSRSAENRK